MKLDKDELPPFCEFKVGGDAFKLLPTPAAASTFLQNIHEKCYGEQAPVQSFLRKAPPALLHDLRAVAVD